jgi:hypothetical protein
MQLLADQREGDQLDEGGLQVVSRLDPSLICEGE